jgi:hypothetical protein
MAGAIVFLPAIRAPLFLDDYFQTSMVEGAYPVPRSPFDLYNFVGDEDRAILMDRGLLPWWSHPKITVRFLRPLSSALIYFDHRVLGNRPLLSHLHSFAWWALAAFGARALYRRAIPQKAGRIATLIFALGACHALPMIWLANREVLVSVALGILGLVALARFADEGRPERALVATFFFALSLLGGEYGLSFGGYAVAAALVGARGIGRRALAAGSYAVPAAGYLVARARLGYGAEGSGFYHDPFRHPWAFVQRVPRRLGTLLAEGWLSMDPEIVHPEVSWWVLGIVLVLGAAAIVVPLRRAYRELDEAQRGHARWLILGSILSMGPVLAVMPDPRVLGASMVGIAGAVGLLLARAWFPPAPEPRAGAAELSNLVALVLGFAHLVHGPGWAWSSCRQKRLEGLHFAKQAQVLSEKVGDPTSAEVVLVRGLTGSSIVLPYALDRKGTPPARWRILALSWHVLVLRRDARTVEVAAPKAQGIFPDVEGNLFHGEGAPFAPGDTVKVPGMRATVLEVGPAGPFRVRFEFDDAADAPPRLWINDRLRGVEDAPPPDVGFGKPFDL